jgi:hypothetical protein
VKLQDRIEANQLFCEYNVIHGMALLGFGEIYLNGVDLQFI